MFLSLWPPTFCAVEPERAAQSSFHFRESLRCTKRAAGFPSKNKSRVHSHLGDLRSPPLPFPPLSTRLPSRPTAPLTGTKLCKRALVDLFIGWDFFFFLPTSVSLAAFWHFCWFIYAVSHHLLKTQSVGQAGGAFGEQSRQAARESSSPSCQLGLLLAEPLGARTARRKRRRDKERPGLSNEKNIHLFSPIYLYFF